jgi:hypothetical protein
MNQTEILAMLHNIIANNQQYTTWTVSTPHIVALVNQAVEAEREACAQLAEGWQYLPENNFSKEQIVENMCKTIAHHIRARGQA